MFERKKEGRAVICDRLLVFMFMWQRCWLELGSTNVPKIYEPPLVLRKPEIMQVPR